MDKATRWLLITVGVYLATIAGSIVTDVTIGWPAVIVFAAGLAAILFCVRMAFIRA